MIDLTEHLLQQDGPTLDQGLIEGTQQNVKSLKSARASWKRLRVKYGFSESATKLLSAPETNLKLAKGVETIYGLTLQHYVQKLTTGLTVNTCPYAGDCTKVCVLDNGGGLYAAVQKTRRAKTEFMATDPYNFGILLGYELVNIVEKEPILLRPNVNSDLQWETIAPSLTSGELFGEALHSYGYSKLPETLNYEGGWIDQRYRVAYSWNEKADSDCVSAFMAAGGNVAVVTNRRPHDPIRQWHDKYPVVDADLTDEWILENDGSFGDLSAKGKARKLIGSSDFVEVVYGV